ncbi:MAG: AfsR/SARP family transcriptional regulator, partial [Trebonia sp.]
VVTEQAQSLGITTTVLPAAPDTADRREPWLNVAADGVIDNAGPPALASIVRGVAAFQLTEADATALLQPIVEAHTTADDAADAAAGRSDNALGVASAPGEHEQPWTAPATTRTEAAPIRVRVLGPTRIEAWGHPINSGLRASAYELLAYYLVHPDGVTADAAIDALWPDLDLERGRQRFWTALGNLRARLRGPNGENLDVITKTGSTYRPDPDTLDVDLWQFQQALHDAQAAPSAQVAADALRRAAAVYTGDFCPGADYLWAGPVREDLHRRALDAHLRLADLLAANGSLDDTITTLQAAVDLDPVCEEAYRRLMSTYAEAGRVDATNRTWQILQGRLAELDLEPTSETTTLVRYLLQHRRPGGSPLS